MWTTPGSHPEDVDGRPHPWPQPPNGPSSGIFRSDLSNLISKPYCLPMDTATLYVRLSRAASETNLSKDGMVADCRALADSLGLAVVGVHVDDGISGAVRDRPEFLAWLADAEEGRASTLIAYHGDRLTREGINAAALVLDVIEGKDTKTGKVVREPVRFLTVDDRLDSNDEEGFRLRFVLQAEIGRAERQRMKARTKAARARLAEQGRWTGRPPYGTRLIENPDGAGKVLDIEEEEAAYLREAADRLLRGSSVLSTARWLNESGSKPRRAANWSPTALTDSLLAAGKRGLIFSPTHSASIVALLDKPKGAPRRQGPPRYLLSRGGAVCTGCGAGLTVNHRAGRPTYRCPSATNGSQCDRRVSIAVEAVDKFVTREFLTRYGTFAHYVEEVTFSSDADVDAAQREWDTAHAALSAELTADALAHAKVAKEALEAAQAAPKRRESTLRDTGNTLAQAWEEADIADRQNLLRGVLSGPTRVLPPPRRGRVNVTDAYLSERLDIPWRGSDPESQYADFLRDLERDAADYTP